MELQTKPLESGQQKRAMIAMSGGVDSSVAAYLTREQGFACTGVTMRLYDNEDAGLCRSNTCCSLTDVEDARAVAYQLGMPFYVFNFTQDFRHQVIDRFVAAYQQGITPNPCIDCNRYLKFERLLQRAEVLGYDYVVTGHYARILRQGDGYVLKKALDETKDQSYVLFSMTQHQLAHTLFPLGELRKTQTRQIAGKLSFVNAKKHDSQDICFVPDGDYARVIALHTGSDCPEGNFVDLQGNILGRHKGLIHYTVGQRKGLGLALPQPHYVLRICPESNTVVLAEDRALWSNRLTAQEVHWISGSVPEGPVSCKAKVRYRHTEQPAIVTPTGNATAEVVFDAPQRAITPGQFVVFYDGDTVLGGGVIARAPV